VGEGPTFKRSQPKARGSAGPIRKRTSHIRITLTDEIEIKRRDTAAKTKKPRSKKAAAKPAPVEPATETSAPAADSKE
jgi:large subunit ribosomal protein L22